MRKGNKNAPTGQENHVKISANTSPKTTIIHSVPTEWTLQQILPCLVNILCRLNFILPLNSLLWPHPTRKKGSLIWKAHTNNVSSFLHWGHVFTSFIIGVWILRSISLKLSNDEKFFFKIKIAGRRFARVIHTYFHNKISSNELVFLSNFGNVQLSMPSPFSLYQHFFLFSDCNPLPLLCPNNVVYDNAMRCDTESFKDFASGNNCR